jgi:hypothetical protein
MTGQLEPYRQRPDQHLCHPTLAINTNGYIFAGADFVGGAGGVYRFTDYGDSWAEINHDMIQTDVRSLATNSGRHIFAGTYFAGSVFRSTDSGDTWTPVNKGLECGNIWSLAINPPERSSPEQQDTEQTCIAQLTTATAGRPRAKV